MRYLRFHVFWGRRGIGDALKGEWDLMLSKQILPTLTHWA